MKYRTSAIVRIVCWSIAALMLTSALVTGIRTAGPFGNWSFWFGEFQTVEDNTLDLSGVTDIDIELVSGSVNIVPTADGTASYTEYARGEGAASLLTFSIQGGTLTVRQKKQYGWQLFYWGVESRRLELRLPAEQVWALLKVKTTSADIQLQADATDMRLTTVSGDVRITGSQSGKLTASTTSGDINAVADANDISLKSVSGNVRLTGGHAEKLNASTTSGDVQINAGADDVSLHSVSGGIRLSLSTCPNAIQANTTSGDIALSVPENSGFTASYSTVSGDFRCGLAGISGGKSFVYGDGSRTFNLKTVSGNIRIN